MRHFLRCSAYAFPCRLSSARWAGRPTSRASAAVPPLSWAWCKGRRGSGARSATEWARIACLAMRLAFALSGAPLFDASFFGAALFAASAFGRGVRPLLPVPEEDDEGDVVRHQKGRNPECGDPVRRSHMGRRAIDRGECYGGDQIHSALDVEDPHQKPRTPGVESYSRNRSDGQQSRNQVTKGRWIGELWSYAGVGASGCQEHQAEVAESVQQQNREQDGPRSQLVESWKQIDLGRGPEHQGAEEKIDREDIHGEFSCLYAAMQSGRIYTVSSCPWHSPRLEKLFERFSPEPCHHLRVGNAFHAPKLFQAEEARAVADEGGPVELADHSALLHAQAGFVESRFGIVLEKRAVRRDGEAVEEAVEPQPLGAGREVEEVSALEFFDAFELGVQSRSFASLRMTSMPRRDAHPFAPSPSARAPRTAPPPSRWSSAGSSFDGSSLRAARGRRASRAT